MREKAENDSQIQSQVQILTALPDRDVMFKSSLDVELQRFISLLWSTQSVSSLGRKG
jgi:hypothetical protein